LQQLHRLVDRYLESRIDREQHAIIQHGRSTLVASVSDLVEWPVHWLKDLPDPAGCRASVRAELKLPRMRLLGVGVDRLDYTKASRNVFSPWNAVGGAIRNTGAASPSYTGGAKPR